MIAATVYMYCTCNTVLKSYMYIVPLHIMSFAIGRTKSFRNPTTSSLSRSSSINRLTISRHLYNEHKIKVQSVNPHVQ